MGTKSSTKNENGKAKRKPPAVVENDAAHWENQYWQEIGKKRKANTRDAVFSWLRRSLCEFGNMMNVIRCEPVRDAFTVAEREKVDLLLDKVWREMTDGVEALAIPAELLAIQHVPVISPD